MGKESFIVSYSRAGHFVLSVPFYLEYEKSTSEFNFEAT